MGEAASGHQHSLKMQGIKLLQATSCQLGSLWVRWLYDGMVDVRDGKLFCLAAAVFPNVANNPKFTPSHTYKCVSCCSLLGSAILCFDTEYQSFVSSHWYYMESSRLYTTNDHFIRLCISPKFLHYKYYTNTEFNYLFSYSTIYA